MNHGLTLLFGRARGDALRVSAGDQAVIEDGRIRTPAGEVAVHENHLWATKQGRFSRFDIEQSVEVSFASDAGSSRPFGPIVICRASTVSSMPSSACSRS